MGVVYLAADTLLDREIALKVVHEELRGARGERLAALFQQEARNLAGLNHPGIVQIFDYSGLYSTRLYLVMEYVPGRDLGELLAGGPLDEALVGHVGLGVATVLAYAHRHGIIHQDLKPENILVTRDGRLKLTDFGISRRLSVDPATEDERFEVVGTPAYMAPEQAMGRRADPRGDVFSLGATLYTLATDCTLVDGLSPAEAVSAIARGDFPPVRHRRLGLDPGLAAIVDRALALDPERRFGAATEMAAALATWLGVPTPKADDVPRVPVELLAGLGEGLPERAQELHPTASATAEDAAPAGSGAGDAPRALAETALVPPASLDLDPLVASDLDAPRLLGRFRLDRKLGAGALGELWVAYDAVAGDEPIALKLFRPAPGASIDEFKAEFRDLATLRHPNLVGIRDFGLIDGHGGAARDGDHALAFYTMDYIDGPDIRRAAQGAPLDEIYELLVQLARALVFLHTRTKRPHLSLKPENILVCAAPGEDGRPRVVVTDPGNPIEKLRSLHRGDRSSLSYAAPETLGGLGAGPAADLYALGAIAYELLTGQPPFHEPTSESLRAAHIFKAPRDPRALRGDLPAPIARVLLELLHKEPARRPAGAESFILAVNQVVVPPYPFETDATRVARFSSAPWVGREEALEALITACRRALEPRSRAPRLALVCGRRGLGKGRLLEELRRAAQLEGAVVLEGSQATRLGRPLEPLGAVLAARHRGRFDDPTLAVELRRVLHAVIGGAREGDGAEAVPPGLVAELLMLDVAHPTVILLRAAQRMDRATLEVIGHVARALGPMGGLLDERELPPLFVTVTVAEDELAPDARALIDALPGVVRVRLPPLSPAGVAEMVAVGLGGTPLAAGQLETLHRVTGGVPGDVQDVIYTLVESGELSFRDDAWHLRPGVDVPLPRSVEEALRQRLLALSQDERDVLEALCVFSGPVPANVIDSLGEGAPQAVKALIEREVLARRPLEERVSLTFAHETFREALLRELSPAARAARHRAAAEWIEAHRPAEQVVEALAAHWSQAGEPQRALDFLLEAAERTASAGDLGRTIEWYREALEILPRAGLGVVRRLRTEAQIRRRAGEACRASGDLAAAEDHSGRLLAIGRDLEDDDIVASARDQKAVVLIDALRFDEALVEAEAARALAASRSDRRGEAMSLRLIGTVRRELGDPEAGIEALRHALHVIDGAGAGEELSEVRVRAAVSLSYTYVVAGHPEEGIATAEWGLRLVRDRDLPELEVSLLINVSMAAFVAGLFERALGACQEAMALSHAKGLRHYHTLALGNLGDTLRALGVFEDAELHLRLALRATYAAGSQERVVGRLLELAALSMDRETPRLALPYLREAWRVVPHLRDAGQRSAVSMAELRLRLWCGEGEHRATGQETEALLDGALARLEALPEASRMRAHALAASAAVSTSPEDARHHAAEAIALARRLPAAEVLRHVDVAAALVEVFACVGQDDDAQMIRAEATRAITRAANAIRDEDLARAFLAVPARRRLMRPPSGSAAADQPPATGPALD